MYQATNRMSLAQRLFMSRKTAISLAVIMLFIGGIIVLLGAFQVVVDENREFFKSYSAILDQLQDIPYWRKWRARPKIGLAYIGYGIWLGSITAITGIIGFFYYMCFWNSEIAQGIYQIFVAFQVVDGVALLILASYSVDQEWRNCRTTLFENAEVWACEKPYSTWTMNMIYGLMLFCAIVTIFLAIYILVLEIRGPIDFAGLGAKGKAPPTVVQPYYGYAPEGFSSNPNTMAPPTMYQSGTLGGGPDKYNTGGSRQSFGAPMTAQSGYFSYPNVVRGQDAPAGYVDPVDNSVAI